MVPVLIGNHWSFEGCLHASVGVLKSHDSNLIGSLWSSEKCVRDSSASLTMAPRHQWEKQPRESNQLSLWLLKTILMREPNLSKNTPESEELNSSIAA